MCVNSAPEFTPGLPLEEIERRLSQAVESYHREESRICRYLLEVERRALYRKRGFSSVRDYAFALFGISLRKTQYLLFVARNLEGLPEIAKAFETGEISWTKAREIARVARAEDQRAWLEKAKRCSNRELEKLVRHEERAVPYDLLRVWMPRPLMEIWMECEELAERLAGAELELYQVLELMMAEFQATYAARDIEPLGRRRESEEEAGIPLDLRRFVLERDGYRCQFPDCSMRAQLEIHHIRYRSQGGKHLAENLVLLCSAHHGLIHNGICAVEGKAPDELKWFGPHLKEAKGPLAMAVEATTAEATTITSPPVSGCEAEAEVEDLFAPLTPEEREEARRKAEERRGRIKLALEGFFARERSKWRLRQWKKRRMPTARDVDLGEERDEHVFAGEGRAGGAGEAGCERVFAPT